MSITHHGDDEQLKRWNGHAGHAWVEVQEPIEAMFKPIEDMLVAAVAAGSASKVLDVGCGTGGTTLAVAQLLGEKGHSVGIDISEPMLAAARGRAETAGVPATFIQANAQDYAFDPGSFDMVISRFGVMFFADSVLAFANLRRATAQGAKLCCVTWRSPAENPFMTTAERAAAPLLPNLPPRQPDAPGQFAFADRDKVLSILKMSGWTHIDIQPVDIECTLPEQQLTHFVTRLGPLGLIFHELNEQIRTQIVHTVRAAFDPYVHGAEVRYTAACWKVSARS